MSRVLSSPVSRSVYTGNGISSEASLGIHLYPQVLFKRKYLKSNLFPTTAPFIPQRWKSSSVKLSTESLSPVNSLKDEKVAFIKQDSSEENSESSSLVKLYSSTALAIPLLAAIAGDDAPSYSQASYYTSLGLFILSVPGVWSLIKRSTKSKIVKKTFVVDGPGKPDAKPLKVLAAEIMSLLTRRNYAVVDRSDVVTFEGVLTPNRSQGFFLVFCTLLSLASVALVLSITVPDVGENWYYLTALSPLSGLYYFRKATRTEQLKVKMVISDDEQLADVIIQGDDEEVDRLRRELGLLEKGMVYVKGILEQ